MVTKTIEEFNGMLPIIALECQLSRSGFFLVFALLDSAFPELLNGIPKRFVICKEPPTMVTQDAGERLVLFRHLLNVSKRVADTRCEFQSLFGCFDRKEFECVYRIVVFRRPTASELKVLF